MAGGDNDGVEVAIHKGAPVVHRCGAYATGERLRTFKIAVANHCDRVITNRRSPLLPDQPTANNANAH
jgi:hypothetical protein